MNSDEQNEYRVTDLSQYTDQNMVFTDQLQQARPKTNTTN